MLLLSSSEGGDETPTQLLHMDAYVAPESEQKNRREARFVETSVHARFPTRVRAVAKLARSAVGSLVGAAFPPRAVPPRERCVARTGRAREKKGDTKGTMYVWSDGGRRARVCVCVSGYAG
jgi:hypothetical protein